MTKLYQCDFCKRTYGVERYAHQCEVACKKKAGKKK